MQVWVSVRFGPTPDSEKLKHCTLWWFDKQALHHLRLQVESNKIWVCTGSYLQYGGGGGRIIPQSFSSSKGLGS